ncbi:zinc metalloprotease HtpX [Candidatus Roizmanbacteria bacterium]|nr:zinc metalloprotease HtpX [Candidatus Roizmanbacteria bacterium]
MTIYTQISRNKIRSFLLIFLFIGILSFVFYLIGKTFGDPTLYFIIGFLFSVVSGIGSYFYSDKLVLFTTGAKPAIKKKYFDFYTVAENISIAVGLPMPKLYVVDDSSPNAFATGRNPNHAVVAATTGLLEKLDRAELEGVIAHEFAHVKNYDILLSSVVAVLVGTIVFAVDWVMRSWWWGGFRDEDRRGINPILLIFLVATLIIAPIAATLIQLAVSRKRELLADATGALVTRNPDALADALYKISADPRPLQRASGSTAHLFIVNPFKKKAVSAWFVSLFSTHPPIEERIRVLREM